ncbi:MAG: archaellin/type IV pilin N-terminal domain-containing protein [Candidatus Aenigmatarchaeota archaeon]
MKKGVTPVIAIIMLVLIVLVMVGGVFTWMQTMQGQAEEVGQEEFEEIMSDAADYIEVESVACSGSSLDEVWIHNSHDTTDFTLDYYVDGSLKDDQFSVEAGETKDVADDLSGVSDGSEVKLVEEETRTTADTFTVNCD